MLGDGPIFESEGQSLEAGDCEAEFGVEPGVGKSCKLMNTKTLHIV